MANDQACLITVYRSPREEGLYLYVSHAEQLSRVPDDLLKHFGKPVETLRLHLTPERKLARTQAIEVLNSVREKGYYLQLPPLNFVETTP